MNIAKFTLTLATLVTGASAMAQPYGQADADRRAQNRAEILAKHPEAQRMVGEPAATSRGPVVRDPVARAGRKAYGATTDFAERQKSKVRRMGNRIERNVPPAPR